MSPEEKGKTGRKALPEKERLVNQGMKVPPGIAEHIAKKSAAMDSKPSTVAREYLIYGIETERKSPGLFEAMVFWNTLNQLPDEWRTMIVKLVQTLNNATLESDAKLPDARVQQAESVETHKGGGQAKQSK